MSYPILLVCLLSFMNMAIAENKVPASAELHGQVDLQYKALKRNANSDDIDGQDNWQNDKVQILNANINGEFDIWMNTLKVNWFVRQSQTELFEQNNSAATQALYPATVITRNLFRLKHYNQNGITRTESVLNRFEYMWGDDEADVVIGRMYIEYGSGFFFNPINPFMIPTAFSTFPNTKQGNDGIAFILKRDEKLKLHIHILGDKQFTGDDEITRTAFIRAAWQYDTKTHVNFVVAEDQRRQKQGAEATYNFSDNAHDKMVVQFLGETKQLNEKENTRLQSYYLVAYQKELTQRWVSRLEFGKNDVENIGEKVYGQTFYLPFRSYLGLANTYAVSDNTHFKFHLINSVDTQLNYSMFDFAYNFHKNAQIHMFTLYALGNKDKKSSDLGLAGQNLLPQQAGVGLRAYF